MVLQTADGRMHQPVKQPSIILSLYVNSGYWKVETDNADSDNTAFNSKHWLFRFSRMSLVCAMCLTHFKEPYMHCYLWWERLFARVYLEEIIILSSIVDKHMSHSPTIWALIQKLAVTFNLKKCKIVKRKDWLVAKLIGPGSFEQAAHTTDATRPPNLV